MHRRSELPGLEFELQPGFELLEPNDGVTIRTNSHGMRSPEIPLEKQAGVVRIAAVGDSFTFGLGVEDDETYPRVLEGLLNEHGDPDVCYEVLNFGVSTYSTRDEALVLRHKALAFGPDLVVVGYVFNDPETHPDQGLHLAFHEPAWWERLHMTRLVAYHLRKRAVRRHGGYAHYLHAADEAPWASVVAAFSDIRAATAAPGVPVVLAVFPNLNRRNDWKLSSLPPVRKQVLQEARRNGFSTLDVAARVRRLVPHQGDVMLATHNHANAEGNRVFAHVVFDFLVAAHPDALRWRVDDRPR